MKYRNAAIFCMVIISLGLMLNGMEINNDCVIELKNVLDNRPHISDYLTCDNKKMGIQASSKNIGRLPSFKNVSSNILHTIKFLDISNNNVTALPLALLCAYCPYIEEINASKNCIFDLGCVSALVGVRVCSIDLAHNKLKHMDIDNVLTMCPQLALLNISHNPLEKIQCEDTRAWQRDHALDKGDLICNRLPMKQGLNVILSNNQQNHIPALERWYVQKSMNNNIQKAVQISATYGAIGGGCISAVSFPMIFVTSANAATIVAAFGSPWIVPTITAGMAYAAVRSCFLQHYEDRAQKEAEENICIVDDADEVSEEPNETLKF